MNFYKRLTIINNEIDKKIIEKNISLKNIFSYGSLDIKKNKPDYINNEYKCIREEIIKIRKLFVIYGYVFLIGNTSDVYYGGDISDIIEKIIEMHFDCSKIWISNREFSWCIEINYNYICYSISPYSKIINQIKCLPKKR